jgi:carbon monoxide dehydrogenase subunit G
MINPHGRFATLLAVAGLASAAATAQERPAPGFSPPRDAAAGDPASTPAPPASSAAVETDRQAISDGELIVRKAPPERLRKVDRALAASGDTVDASDVLDEMIDELAADLARVGASRFSPLLFDRIRLSANVSPQFAEIVEARLAAALMRAANLSLVRCMECRGTRTRIESASWVVTRGITGRAQLAQIGRDYGARGLLSVSLTVQQEPASMAMDVELIRPDDATVAFAESYRARADDALLYRGVDRAQGRQQRLEDLQRRLDARPLWGMAVSIEGAWIPVDGRPALYGAIAMVHVLERIGEEREWRVGLSGGGLINSTLVGGVLGATVLRRVTSETVNGTGISVGGTGGVFITGSAGSSAIGTARVEWVTGYRVGLTASLSYLVPFKLQNKDPSYGGVIPGLGAALTW